MYTVNTWKLIKYVMKLVASLQLTMRKVVARKKEKYLESIILCLLKEGFKVGRKMYSIMKSHGLTAQI